MCLWDGLILPGYYFCSASVLPFSRILTAKVMSKPTQDSMYKVSGKYFYALLPEVGDSSHMTGKFKDL